MTAPSGPFRALAQRRAHEEIIVQVEDAIMRGELRPGDRLPSERELAETFGVSRPSLREALRTLESFGVLVARRGSGPASGSLVSDGARSGIASALRLHAGLSGVPTADIVQVRAGLEADAARSAAMRAEREDLVALRELIAAMREAEDLAAYHELDTEFHVQLARASGNALLPVMMDALRSVMQRAMLTGFAALDDWRVARDDLVREHDQIVRRIEARDSEGAASAVREHILGFYRRVVEPGVDPTP